MPVDCLCEPGLCSCRTLVLWQGVSAGVPLPYSLTAAVARCSSHCSPVSQARQSGQTLG